MDLKDFIASVPDFPQPGIIFRDITPLLHDRDALMIAVRRLIEPWTSWDVDYICAVESRGFIFGGAAAILLDCGFIPVRKKGKLPRETFAYEYALEYGTDTVELHKDALGEGDRVLIIDDLIATGGTAWATAKLVQEAGAEVKGATFLIELTDLGGRKRLEELGVKVHSLIRY